VFAQNTRCLNCVQTVFKGEHSVFEHAVFTLSSRCSHDVRDLMSFICSQKQKLGAELHVYLEEGTYHKRLFRGPI
jgi:hypothetical protein